jgi:uncharacterized ferredoxin-like protein
MSEIILAAAGGFVAVVIATLAIGARILLLIGAAHRQDSVLDLDGEMHALRRDARDGRP